MKPSVLPLLGQSLQDLEAWAVSHQQPAYRGRQIHSWIYQKGSRSLHEISVLPKQWRVEIGDYPVGRSEIAYVSEARDGTIKLLLKLADGQVIEAVGIPTANRLTVCVSSQVGCPMACDFCATGKLGFTRNLEVHEIVDQILSVQEVFQQRVSHIVFMGMGEPLINLERVAQAIVTLNREVGIGQRHITVSTVGVRHQIQRFAQFKLQVTLAISLHAPNQALREQLIPSAKYYPIQELLHDCRNYVQITGRRVSFEYTLLGGINDRPHHAKELAALIRPRDPDLRFQAHVNLIPYNPIDEVDYQRPQPKQIQQFLQQLQKLQIAASVRQTRGLDQNAACGQLRGSFWTQHQAQDSPSSLLSSRSTSTAKPRHPEPKDRDLTVSEK